MYRYLAGLEKALLPWAILALGWMPAAGHASFLSGETLDTAADWLALFILAVVPIAAIVLFWLVHILPEKIAEKRHHPQKSAINTLCLLSLVFGGMLWPIAWLWAYTRPVAYKAAYGTDKHEDYFRETAHKAEAGELAPREIEHIKAELDDLAANRKLTPELKDVRDRLEAVLASRESARIAAGPDDLAADRALSQELRGAREPALARPAQSGSNG